MMSIPYMQDHGTAKWVRQRRASRLSSGLRAAGRWRRRLDAVVLGREGHDAMTALADRDGWVGGWEGGVERGRGEREEVLAALAGPGFRKRGALALMCPRSWKYTSHSKPHCP